MALFKDPAMYKPTIDQIIVKVTNMVSWDSTANQLAKKAGLAINYVSWEDCARNKGSVWGPCISDMTLRVNGSCMPVIREPNYSDKTWDVEMDKIPIVIGNHTKNKNEKLKTIPLKEYLTNFEKHLTNDVHKKKNKQINLLRKDIKKDSHAIMSSQCCFLPISKGPISSGQETKFNVALYNYQSQAKNPAVLVIVSTSKGSSAQIIEGKEQYLLFNNNGMKADFIGERVSEVRRQKEGNDNKNLYDKKLSKEEKQDNVIVIVQIPLKQKQIYRPQPKFYAMKEKQSLQAFSAPLKTRSLKMKKKKEDVNVEAAIVKVSERTVPVCTCGKELKKFQVQYAYDNGGSIQCDGCGKSVNDKEEIVYHCSDRFAHKNGYDLCVECGLKQLEFDEFRGLLDDDKNYKLERDERYPIRCTLQYYKATDNGAVNKEIIDDIVKQLQSSQKQADFIGSLVNDYDPNRPTEFVNNNDEEKKNDNEYKEIRAALKEHCGNNWQEFLKNFENEEVIDTDLENLTEENLKELIPKMGPRKRFKVWLDSR